MGKVNHWTAIELPCSCSLQRFFLQIATRRAWLSFDRRASYKGTIKFVVDFHISWAFNARDNATAIVLRHGRNKTSPWYETPWRKCRARCDSATRNVTFVAFVTRHDVGRLRSHYFTLIVTRGTHSLRQWFQSMFQSEFLESESGHLNSRFWSAVAINV